MYSQVSTAEKRMQQNRLELLQGAASVGRLDVLERVGQLSTQLQCEVQLWYQTS
jgi:hypothetical protein